MCREGRYRRAEVADGRGNHDSERVSKVERESTSHLGLPQDAAVLLQRQNVSLLLEDLSRALEHHLKPLLAGLCVLLEAIDGELLDAVLDLLPPPAKRCNLGALDEVGFVGRRCCRWCVDAGLADLKEVGPCDVHRAHGELLGDGVDVGGFVHHGCVNAAEDGSDPFRRRLLACDESLCAQLGKYVSIFIHRMYDATRCKTRGLPCLACSWVSLTMPVLGSTDRLKVSTAMTCGVFSFHGPYFCQLLVETSSHE
jgi:hypothetical protein